MTDSSRTALGVSAQTVGRLRAALLALLGLGLAGTATELILLNHYEDSAQLVPLFLVALAFAAIVLQLVAPSVVAVRAFQLTMVLLVAGGVLGVVLHYRGNLGFQLDMDPSQSGWQLFMKVMRAKAPPALAPGVMAQLGLLGLASTYRHPALTDRGVSSPGTEAEP